MTTTVTAFTITRRGPPRIGMSALGLNLALSAVFMVGVGQVASARIYDPWWPSILFGYLVAATVLTLLIAVAMAVLYGGLINGLLVFLATGVELISLLGMFHAVGDDTFIGCPSPPNGSQALIQIQTDLDLVSGRIDCHFSDGTDANTVTTSFPVLLALKGRL